MLKSIAHRLIHTGISFLVLFHFPLQDIQYQYCVSWQSHFILLIKSCIALLLGWTRSKFPHEIFWKKILEDASFIIIITRNNNIYFILTYWVYCCILLKKKKRQKFPLITKNFSWKIKSNQAVTWMLPHLCDCKFPSSGCFEHTDFSGISSFLVEVNWQNFTDLKIPINNNYLNNMRTLQHFWAPPAP